MEMMSEERRSVLMPPRWLPLTQRRHLGQLMVCIFHLPYSITTFSDLTTFFTASNDDDNDEDNAHYDRDFLVVYESLKSLSNSPVPPNDTEEMISPASRFTFVTRQLIGECSGEPFRHFLNLSVVEDFQIAEAYRCICHVEGFCFNNEERSTTEGPDMVVFNFADEMIPVAVKMWKSCLSKDQKVPIDSCIQIMCQR